ncbi:conserved domain protein [Actinomyces sp. oral taxon 170 str. F0386]|nr:conserved domain protein [Actinomyces sp. oral taxon 170 str. F0386]
MASCYDAGAGRQRRPTGWRLWRPPPLRRQARPAPYESSRSPRLKGTETVCVPRLRHQ